MLLCLCYDNKEKYLGVKMSIFRLLSTITQTDDSHAWEAMLREIGGALYCCAFYILNDEALALDALQESYLAIQDHRFKFIKSINDENLASDIIDKKTKAWMLQIVRNKSLNILRTKKVKSIGIIKKVICLWNQKTQVKFLQIKKFVI